STIFSSRSLPTGSSLRQLSGRTARIASTPSSRFRWMIRPTHPSPCASALRGRRLTARLCCTARGCCDTQTHQGRRGRPSPRKRICEELPEGAWLSRGDQDRARRVVPWAFDRGETGVAQFRDVAFGPGEEQVVIEKSAFRLE